MDYKNKQLVDCLKFLRMNNLEELSVLLNIPSKEIALVKDIDTNLSKANREINLTLSDEVKSIKKIISTLYYCLHSLKKHKFSTRPMLFALNKKFKIKGNDFTLLDIIKSKDEAMRGLWSEKIEEILFENFTETHVGSKASEEKLLNKEVAEVIFNQKVEVRRRWEYSEFGGDYQVPEVQVLKEIFPDGSEWWEKLKNYSQDIGCAFEIVDFLGKQGVQIRLSNKALNNGYWWCYMDEVVAQANTPAEAICRAALALKRKET